MDLWLENECRSPRRGRSRKGELKLMPKNDAEMTLTADDSRQEKKKTNFRGRNALSCLGGGSDVLLYWLQSTSEVYKKNNVQKRVICAAVTRPKSRTKADRKGQQLASRRLLY
jgi:hypothetical protein